jgi:hypothetical protein
LKGGRLFAGCYFAGLSLRSQRSSEHKKGPTAHDTLLPR